MRMQIVSRENDADRMRRYREEKGDVYRAKNRQRMQVARAAAVPEFIGVDSEGIGKGKNHRAVLLGVGREQYVSGNIRSGLHWKEVFEFLYAQYKKRPKAAYVGFYLSYDFNNWLKTLPQDKAWLLLSRQGIAMRRMSQPEGKRRTYHPVRVDGWEIDMLGFKRLSIRPIAPGCFCGTPGMKCDVMHLSWMHICDAGPFYQMAFIKVIDPAKWVDDPDGGVCTDAEFAKVQKGKDKRAIATRITKEMCEYNALENELMSRVMGRLAKAFKSIGISLGKDEWYGPGATAGKWLQKNGAPKARDLPKIMPDWFEDSCRCTYFGGWFEIFSHGIIEGVSYNYDINNAYPYATTKLPHLCGKCRYKRGTGNYAGDSKHVLLYCRVSGKSKRIGPVPYRDKDGSILRPSVAKGWYWKHEIDAANRAGLVKECQVYKWRSFTPCAHPEPFTDIRRLYELRLKVGKDSAQGMAIKLTNNSAYGKFAQSTGSAPFNNWFYASYITSHCRTQILDAIASHPRKANAVLMIATDGICFDSPNPSLPVSKILGEWARTEYTDLCLFKPGVYWHREGKQALLKVKSRGVPKAEFAKAIDDVEWTFRQMLNKQCSPGSVFVRQVIRERLASPTDEGAQYEEWRFYGKQGWPWFLVPVNFRVKTCKQALNEGKWEHAAQVQESTTILQNSDPESKRANPLYNQRRRRLDTYVHTLPRRDEETKYYGDIRMPAHTSLGIGFDGTAVAPLLEAVQVVRDKKANYDIPMHAGYDASEYEWETVHEPIS